ncbi:MAG: NosD domain-containing protein [Candidatus ainarchaeum sp.]|nr:NosD domain-containing protein [Candidatus ainarchaeum sp.]
MRNQISLVSVVFLLIAASTVSAQCVNISNPSTWGTNIVNSSGVLYVNENTTLCEATYELNTGTGASMQLNASGIYLNCNGSTLDGVDGSGYGVYATNVDYNTVENCTSQNYLHGFYFKTSTHDRFAFNTMINNTQNGIYGNGMDYGELMNNTAHGNILRGFYLKTSSNSTMMDNVAYNSSMGFVLSTSADGNVLAGNTVHDTHGVGVGGFLVYASYDNLLENNTAYGNDIGFYLQSASDNTFRFNEAYNNTGTGFFIYQDSGYNVLFNNTVEDNTVYGFHIYAGSNSNNLTNNTAAYNGNTGMIIESSYNNTLLNNTAYNNTAYGIYGGSGNVLGFNVGYNGSYGIALTSTTNNTLKNNSLSNNSLNGVFLYNATYCNITGNNASYNYYDGFALYAYSDFNNFESNSAEHNGHDDDDYAFNGFLLEHSSGNAFTGDSAYDNSDLGFFLNTSENNTFNGSTAYSNYVGGIYAFGSDYNIFTGVAANGNLDYGFLLESSSGNNISSAEAYANLGYGIILDGSDSNTISDSNIVLSLIYGMEIYNSSSNLVNNTNISLMYLAGFVLSEGSEGNEMVGLNISDNAAGIVIVVEEQNNITNSIVAENELMDVLPVACFSGALDGVNGSGGRPINYSNSSIEWSHFESSELILCNANYSNLTNVTVRGSDEFNNNALFVMDSGNVSITGSNSSGNYMGFYIYNSHNAILTNNTAMNTSFGGISLESSNYATVRGSSIGNNFADETVIFELGERRVGISLWDSQDVAMYDNAITDIWNSSAFLLEADSSTEGFYNNTITNATNGIEVTDATIIFTGDNFIYGAPAGGSDIYVEGSGYLDAMGGAVCTDFLNYSIYAQDIMAKSVNLSATALSINDTNFNITVPGMLGARVLRTPWMFGAINVTSLASGAAANIAIPYNDSDVASSGYPAGNVAVGAYSSSWTSLGSTSIDTANKTVRKDGIASFSYFVPIAYEAAPASSSGSHGRKDINMAYSFNCSSGRLEVVASYSGDPISGLGMTLFRDGRVQSSGTTDYRGKAPFTLVQDGAYKVVSERTSDYFSGELVLGSLELCPAEGAAEERETPMERALSSLGANQTPAGEEEQPTQSEPQGPTRDDAIAAIAAAQSTISAASDAGKDVGDAQAKLQEASDALALGEYADAIEFAREAEMLAGSAQAREISAPETGLQPSSTQPQASGPDWAFIIGVLLVLLAIAVGAHYLFAKKK